MRPRFCHRRHGDGPRRSLRGRAGWVHRRLPERYRRRHRQSRRQRQSAGRAAVAGAGGRAADVQRRAEEGFHQDQRRQTSRCRHRQAVHRHAARRYRHCHRQQPAARHHRRDDRQLDADVAQPKSALRCGAGGFQVARRQRAGGPGQGAGRGKRPAGQKGNERGACRHRAHRREVERHRQDRRHRRDPRPRRPGRAQSSGQRRGEPIAASARGRRCRQRQNPEHLGDLEHGAERLVRAVARLGAAAGGHRPCHHLRRDGRHQHGAWRDGDARRLHHLRGAGAHPRAQSGAVRLFAGDRHAARLPGRRRRRRRHRAHHHPLPLRPAAGDAARHLGPVADPAAGGAHHLRPDQQGRRQSVLDERRLRSRRHHHHL